MVQKGPDGSGAPPPPRTVPRTAGVGYHSGGCQGHVGSMATLRVVMDKQHLDLLELPLRDGVDDASRREMGCGGRGKTYVCLWMKQRTNSKMSSKSRWRWWASGPWGGQDGESKKKCGGLPLVDTQRCASVGVWDPSWACISLGSGVPAPTARGAAGSIK